MKNSNIKTVVAVGIGAALFFVLGRFVAIPSPVPNTNISLQYAVLGLLAAMYGPVAGALIGFIGHALIDLSWGGIPWWSWVIASAFTGVVVGLFAKKLNVQEGDFNKRKVATFAIANVVAHAIAWIVVAPVLDILIYAEPAKKVFAQGAFAAVSNIITAVVVGGLLILAAYYFLQESFALDIKLALSGAVLAWSIGLIGILISAKPCYLRDAFRFLARHGSARYAAVGYALLITFYCGAAIALNWKA